MVEQSIEKSFLQWLSYRVPSADIDKMYVAFGNIEYFCKKHKVLKDPLFQTFDLETLNKVKRIVDINMEFHLSFNKSGLYKKAMRYYISFVRENEDQLVMLKGLSTGGMQSEKEQMTCDKSESDAVYATKSGKETKALDSLAQYQNNSKVSTEKGKQYSSILREEFKDGFRPNRMIDLNRFKLLCADRYGAGFRDSDDKIISTLESVGSTLNGRIYARQDSSQSGIVREIYEEMQRAFDDGATCIYLKSVMERFRDRLVTELQIYNTDMLKELFISKANGLYGSKYSYIYKYGRTPDTQLDIIRCLEASALPMNFYELRSTLWYIPEEKIKQVLYVTPSIVNVQPETFFYAPNLSLSEDELNNVRSLIQRELKQKTFITDAELKGLINTYYPSIAINMDGFTLLGFRKALGYLLRDDFTFNGRIISKAGKKLNMADLFAQFAHEHESLTLDELKDFADEVNRGYIYWASVLREMIRVSGNLLLRNDQLIFDVDAIDTVLDEICHGQYMTIKSVDLYLHFPVMKIKWNGYLLESFVYRYSKMFCLKNVGFNEGDSCGVVVRRSSGLNDYDEVVLDLLTRSDDWHDKNSALQLLVEQGYQKRKSYRGIEQIMQKANMRKKAIKQTENRG